MFSRNKQPPIKSLIAEGSRIEGNVLFTDGLRIDGEVVGDVRVGPGTPGLLVISAACGATVEVMADGPDELEAIAALSGLVERGFDDEEE